MTERRERMDEVGEATRANFDDNTITLQFAPGFTVQAGFYRVIYLGPDKAAALDWWHERRREEAEREQ